MVGTLPDNLELLTLDAAGKSHQEIADKFGVTRQAVQKRFSAMGLHIKGPKGRLAASLPWDIAGREDKRRLKNSTPFHGLRAFLRVRFGEQLTARSQVALSHFESHLKAGEVLALFDGEGFVYVPRRAADGDLVVRWPKGATRTPAQDALFALPDEVRRSLLTDK